MRKGFTLAEILMVMVLLGILLAIIIPNYSSSTLRAKEAVLKENLFIIRDAINKFYHDKKKYPVALEDLVTNNYLRRVPVDPITNNNQWELVHFEPEDMEDFDPEIAEGIIDVKSRAKGIAQSGSRYDEW